MAPLHHHFELMGWPETTVIVRFWILAGLFAALGLGHLLRRLPVGGNGPLTDGRPTDRRSRRGFHHSGARMGEAVGMEIRTDASSLGAGPTDRPVPGRGVRRG